MRAPITLKIKFKSANLEQFIERYSVDVSRGGIFIRTKEPLAVGTPLKFEFQLQDASSLIAGEGTVMWIRENDPARVGMAPGMGVRFERLAPESQAVLDRILTEKERRGHVPGESRFDSGVRMAATAPGRVAESARAAGGEVAGRRAQSPSPGAPIPPLDTGEDEFGLESTRVMQDAEVRELASRTRESDGSFGHSEPTRKASSDQIQAVLSRPGARPSGVKAVAARDGTGETSSKIEVAPDMRAEAAGLGLKENDQTLPFADRQGPVDLDTGPTNVQESRRGTGRASLPLAAQRGTQVLPWVLGAMAAVVAVVAWWSYSGPGSAETGTPTAGKGVPPRAANGVAGGSTGRGAQAAPQPPPGVAMGVTSEPPGAAIILDGVERRERTPTTLAGLEPARSYQLRLELKGFVPWQRALSPQPGEKLEATLLPSERVVEVSSTPAGADVIFDGRRLGKTPFVVRQLNLGRPHDLKLRRPGFLPQSRTINAADKFDWKGEQEVLALVFTLEPEPSRPPRAARPIRPKPVPPKAPAAGVEDKAREPGAEKPPAAPSERPGADKATERAAEKAPETTADKPGDKPPEKADKKGPSEGSPEAQPPTP